MEENNKSISLEELGIDFGCILTDHEAWEKNAYVYSLNAEQTDRYLDSIAGFSHLAAEHDVPKHFPENEDAKILKFFVDKTALIGMTQRLHKFYPLHDFRKLIEVREIVEIGLHTEHLYRGGDTAQYGKVRLQFIQDELNSINTLRLIIEAKMQSAEYRIQRMSINTLLDEYKDYCERSMLPKEEKVFVGIAKEYHNYISDATNEDLKSIFTHKALPHGRTQRIWIGTMADAVRFNGVLEITPAQWNKCFRWKNKKGDWTEMEYKHKSSCEWDKSPIIELTKKYKEKIV